MAAHSTWNVLDIAGNRVVCGEARLDGSNPTPIDTGLKNAVLVFVATHIGGEPRGTLS